MTNGELSSPLPSSPSAAPGAANERNGAWRILLPSVIDGPVALVDLLPGTAAAFRRSYPGAITVSSDETALVDVSNGRLWDGRHWPLPERSVALLVADERRLDPVALATALRPGGIRASIVPARRSRGLVPYPTPEDLERILRPEWPPSTRAPRRWSRERLATSPAWRLSSRAGLLIDGCDTGLVDEVVGDVGLATGQRREVARLPGEQRRQRGPARCACQAGGGREARDHRARRRPAGAAAASAGRHRVDAQQQSPPCAHAARGGARNHTWASLACRDLAGRPPDHARQALARPGAGMGRDPCGGPAALRHRPDGTGQNAGGRSPGPPAWSTSARTSRCRSRRR